jgi:hypothetical protein
MLFQKRIVRTNFDIYVFILKVVLYTLGKKIDLLV